MNTPSKLENLFTLSAYPPSEIPDAVLEECIRFRTAIYVAEGYMPEPEQSVGPDCFDPQSAHFCIRSKKDNQISAYCRMIYDAPYPLPMAELHKEVRHAPDFHVEISRFSIRNHWRGRLKAVDMPPFFLLTQALLVHSHREGIRQWGCLIDERFQTMCKRHFKMAFHILGQPRMYMGSPSVPCIINLDDTVRNNLLNSGVKDLWMHPELQQWVAELK